MKDAEFRGVPVGVKSYADAVRSPRSVLHRRSSLSREISSPYLEVTSKEEDIVWLKGCYVGEVSEISTLQDLELRLRAAGISNCLARPCGGRMVLLNASGRGSMEDIIGCYGNALFQIFKDIRPWHKRVLDTGRPASLRCYGVPLQVWTEEFFAKVAQRWGRLISVDPATKDKVCLEVARFDIHTTFRGIIHDLVEVRVDGLNVKLLLQEESSAQATYRKSDPSTYVSFVEDSGQAMTRGCEGCPVRKTSGTKGAPSEIRTMSNGENSGDRGNLGERNVDGQRSAHVGSSPLLHAMLLGYENDGLLDDRIAEEREEQVCEILKLDPLTKVVSTEVRRNYSSGDQGVMPHRAARVALVPRPVLSKESVGRSPDGGGQIPVNSHESMHFSCRHVNPIDLDPRATELQAAFRGQEWGSISLGTECVASRDHAKRYGPEGIFGAPQQQQISGRFQSALFPHVVLETSSTNVREGGMNGGEAQHNIETTLNVDTWAGRSVAAAVVTDTQKTYSRKGRKKKKMAELLNLCMSSEPQQNGGSFQQDGQQEGGVSEGNSSCEVDSFSDSLIGLCNKKIVESLNQEEASAAQVTPTQIWNFLAKIGIQGDGRDGEMIDRIATFEERDEAMYVELQKQQHLAEIREAEDAF
ncbi:hypothetical protein Ancab_039875 [Ancistrocladus abbreviatus]